MYYKDPAYVHHSGAIDWGLWIRFTTWCPMNMTKFPFDEHQCELEFEPSDYQRVKYCYDTTMLKTLLQESIPLISFH